MQRFHTSLLMAAVALLTAAMPASAAVDWQLINTIPLEAEPLDMAMSADGQYSYILTADGRVLVYSADGTGKGEIAVGKEVTGIAISPDGGRLFLQDAGGRQVKVVAVDFIVEISSEGAPTRGPAEAPVQVAIFSDFQ